jgi:adenine phosphoribosyltransferase
MSTLRRLVLGTTSALKVSVAKKFVDKYYANYYQLMPVNCDILNLPAQPIGQSTHLCGYARLEFIRQKYPDSDYLTIESGANLGDGAGPGFDFCTSFFEKDGLLAIADHPNIHPSIRPRIDREFINQLVKLPLIRKGKIEGYERTLGQIMKDADPSIDDKNWMKTQLIDRADQIEATLDAVYRNQVRSQKNKAEIISTYQIYKDYPQKGVDFQDVFSVFRNGLVNLKMMDLLITRFRYSQIDYVIGLEARGFCLGYTLAYELTKLTGHAVGFLPVRKDDSKLPGEVIKTSYRKEYGVDICKMPIVKEKGKRVIIIDDLVAVGGTLGAGLQLALMQGFEVVDCCAIRQVNALEDNAKKQIGRPYTILLRDSASTQ